MGHVPLGGFALSHVFCPWESIREQKGANIVLCGVRLVFAYAHSMVDKRALGWMMDNPLQVIEGEYSTCSINLAKK
jgi:hypothetical protein